VIANELEKIERGEGEKEITILCLPPRHGKSELATINFPAWYLGKNPTKEVITASYSGELAQDFGTKTRDLVSGEAYKEIFDLSLRVDAKAKAKWQTEKNGSYTSVGIGGALTGRGANVLVVDDPIKNSEEANSKVIRDKHWNWFKTTAYTRLEKNASVIIILTRWHLDDLAGRLLEDEGFKDRCKLIEFKAISEEDEEYRKKGEALWEWKFDLEKLQQIKESQGLYNWSSLYQQHPIATELQDFKEEWMNNNFKLNELHEKKIVTFCAIDYAKSKNEGADYTGITVVGVDEVFNWFIIYSKQLKLNITERIELLFDIWAGFKSYNLVMIGVEEKAYEDTIAPLIEKEMQVRGIFPNVIELKDKGVRKEDRIKGKLVPRFQYGKIYFKHKDQRFDHTDKLIEQCLLFPKSRNDDLIDSLAYIDDIAYAPHAEQEDFVKSEAEQHFDNKIKKDTHGDLKIANKNY